MVNFHPFSAGGPYILTITGSIEKIEFKNILIGDVWFASGQSNMEHPMSGWNWVPNSAVSHSKEEIANSDYPEIRLFSVPKHPSPIEQKDISAGKWEMASPESVAGFSSTAWFFGKEIYKKLKIPIGIINCSWAGTPIQIWMSRESLEHFKDSLKLPDVPGTFDPTAWSGKVKESIEKTKIRRTQISLPPAGISETITNPIFDDSSWKPFDLLSVANHFANIVWLRKTIDILEHFANQQLELSLGFLNRQSHIFLNGLEVGYFMYPQPVILQIHHKLVHSGENNLTIRLAQPWGEAQALGVKAQFSVSNRDHLLFRTIDEV